jgi:hypothetical protein
MTPSEVKIAMFCDHNIHWKCQHPENKGSECKGPCSNCTTNNMGHVTSLKRESRLIIVGICFISMLLGCTKISYIGSNTLKDAVNQGSLELNTAIDVISSSKVWSILTISAASAKSLVLDESAFKVYITLDTIKGIYEYKPVKKTDRLGLSLMRYFTKKAENNKMIVRMPFKKVTNPGTLREYTTADTSLSNNFSISVSDYHNNYNNYSDFDYLLTSEISIDDIAAGNLNIKYIVNQESGIDYASEYVFNEGYDVAYKYESGDTTVSSFTISEDSNVLYGEKLLTIKTDTGRFGSEQKYILNIGDVEITRSSGAKVATVSVNGELQSNATITVIDNESDSEASVCKKRDIRITFNDGSTTTVSALIGSSVSNIKTLFDSLHSVYFAAYVVDWIAYDIYYQRD